MKMTRTIAAVVTAGALLTGIGATTAFAADATPGANGGRLANVGKNFDCSKADEVKATLEHTKASIVQIRSERSAMLAELKATATDAGLTKVADRIEQRMTKMAERDPKVGARIDKLEAKIDAKCSSAG